ncbi:CapA family protein [Clostridium sardiniense]
MDNQKRSNSKKQLYRKKQIKKRRILRNRILFFGLLFIVIGGTGYIIHNYTSSKTLKSTENNSKNSSQAETPKEEETPPKKEEILLTAAGDFTLGTDDSFDKATSLPAAVSASGNNYSYLLKNVKDIFEGDDYTLVNLETTFTNSTNKLDKGHAIQFHFKGPSEFAKILTSSSIEGVTIANNHIYDYGKQGFNDTVNTLKNNKVDITGEGYVIEKEIKGIKFGFLGYQAWDNGQKIKDKISKDIKILKDKGTQVIIPYFHWGIEKDSKPSEYQIDLAHFAIDSGASMVLGSHPHVIQTLENYKGKLIAYSLSNFCFGGNSNPADKRTFILQSKFDFEGDTLKDIEYKVIPATISSVSNKNDYIPTVATGEKGKTILNYINSLSPTLKGSISDSYFKLQKNS